MRNKQEVQIKYNGVENKIIESRAVIKEFVYSLDDFSEKADPKKSKDHRSYVYALCEKKGDNLIPFYIGEGKGPRVWSHELETTDQIKLLEKELAEEGRLEELEERTKDLKEKNKRINDITKRNGKIVKYIIKWGMTAKEAFMAESALINLLQIGGLKFDCTENADRLTNIVKGHQSEGEKLTGMTKARTVEEFCEEFAKEPLYFEDLQKNKVNALLININRGYNLWLKNPDKVEREKAIKDIACGNWDISPKRFKDLGIEYVFATVQARVVGVYKIKEVAGKKLHFMYESAYDNSEYPHGDGSVPYRTGDYNLAKMILSAANKKGKHPSELVLNDMPTEYIEKLKREKNVNNPENAFKRILENRNYMILENISEDDPKYEEYIGYMYRRIIHTDRYVEITKEKIMEAQRRGEICKKDAEKVTNNIYGSGNPIKYIDGTIIW